MSDIQSLGLVETAWPRSARIFMDMLLYADRGHLTLTVPGGHSMLFGQARQEPAADLVVHDWRAIDAMLDRGDMGFAEAIRQGWLDSSDMTRVMRFALQNESALKRALIGQGFMRLIYLMLHRFRANTRKGSRRNIEAHYDLGNTFYQVWLDHSWSYSSALFEGNMQRTLEQAQWHKYQRIINKLHLIPGMHVLEIGCGWGGFAEHAALQGIHVHGITLSIQQLEWAKARIKAAGLSHLVELELCDYRDVQGRWDAVVSIEMFEAVGEAYWETYMNKVRQVLKPGAQALIQTITIDEDRFASYRRSSDFIRHYIFPGGMLPSLPRFSAVAARSGLLTRDVLAFGKDYAETLRRWRDAFEVGLPEIRLQGFDDVFIRTWSLYLSYCEAGFEENRIDVVQVLLEAMPEGRS